MSFSWVRLRHQPTPPPTKHGSEALYADADGNLKHLASDGTVSSVGGGTGGSQPNVLTKTYTAAEIAAAWDAGAGAAAFEIAEFNEGDVVLYAWEYPANTLDQDVTWGDVMAYTPGADSGNVWNNGSSLNSDPGAFAAWNTGTYAATKTLADTTVGVPVAAATIYFAVSGPGDPPTEGEITVAIVLARAS